MFCLGVEVGEFGTGVRGRGSSQRLVKVLSVLSMCSLTVSNTTGGLCEQKVVLHSVSRKREGSWPVSSKSDSDGDLSSQANFQVTSKNLVSVLWKCFL